MKRRDFIEDVITVTLATAAVSLSGPAAAGGMRSIGSQVRQGVNKELREGDGEESKQDAKEEAKEEVRKEPEAEVEAGKESLKETQ